MSPLYDRLCSSCGWCAIDVMEAIETEPKPCPECGTETKRAWLTKPPNAIGDETDFVTRNGAKNPIRFRSKSEHRRWLKQNGYRIKDDHVGMPGSDKSPNTQAWATGGKQWLADAEELAKRNGTARGNDPVDTGGWNIKWSTGSLTPEQVEKYRSGG